MAQLKKPKEADMYPSPDHLERTRRVLGCKDIHGAYFAHNLILLSRTSEDHDWLKKITSNSYFHSMKDQPGMMIHDDHFDCFYEFEKLGYLEKNTRTKYAITDFFMKKMKWAKYPAVEWFMLKMGWIKYTITELFMEKIPRTSD